MLQSWAMKRIVFIIALVLMGCSNFSDFKTAKDLVRERKFYNAIEYYLSFVYKNPEHPRSPEALFEIGKIQQMMLGEVDKSIETYRKLVANYPINIYTVQAQRRIADIFKNNYSNYRQALTEYDKLIRAVPNDKSAAEVQFEIADCYTLLHEYDQADLEYQALIEKYPLYENIEQVFVKKGTNAYISGKYEMAIENYQKALNLFPETKFKSDVIFGLASSYDELDDFEKASTYYRQIKDTYPSPKVIDIRLAGIEKRRQKKSYRDTKL